MLGFIGFITSSILVIGFAASFEQLISPRLPDRLWQFIAAYYLLGITLAFWGVACLVKSPDWIQFSVLLGDGLLMAGTSLLATMLVHKRHLPLTAFLGLLLTLIASIGRPFIIPIHAYISDGILYFNTPRAVGVVLVAALVFVWLPAAVRVCTLITLPLTDRLLRNGYISSYGTAIAVATIFITAHRREVIIVSFAAITFMFALLVGSNFMLAYLVKPDIPSRSLKRVRHAK
jgi:hypothetical protein